MDELVILDFETTGLSPSYARIIEIGAVLVKNKKIVDKISQLMDPGRPIPHFITQITGITNKMVKGMPAPEEVMPTLNKFIANRPILAHNATFDQKFLVAEMENIDKEIKNKFLCSMKLARRLIPDSPNYKLTTLIAHLNIKIPKDQKAHRALNDVLSTFHLWSYLEQFVSESTGKLADINFYMKLSNQSKNKVADFLRQHSEN